ncbi:MAG: flagellar basal body P-ring protein FlgI [Planctomycetes bacterium]|nr:flagellar basal body P-ring protein FlgI [Planctomycetota bacterium]
MIRKAFPILVLLIVLLAPGAVAQRVKDIATIQGVRNNHLKGFGLVVGLPGTGDGDSLLARKPMVSMLERLNLAVPLEGIATKNVAVVMVTAVLPPFQRPGGQIDVSVHSIADASSLRGGTLLPTPLQGPGFRDPTVYAVAQGPVSIGQIPTTARIPNGGIVETVPPTEFFTRDAIYILLDHPDFTVAKEVAKEINEDRKLFQASEGDLPEYDRPGPLPPIAEPVDAATVKVVVPEKFAQGDPGRTLVHFVSLIEQVSLSAVDNEATVVINENTGTVLFNPWVRVSPVLITHNNLQLRIPGAPGVPERVMPLGEVDLTNDVTRPLQEIIDGLNALGVGPKDLIDIIKAMKEAGAIQAKVVVIN